MSDTDSVWPGVVGLLGVVAGVTTLTALGTMSAGQAMPILGGVVVIVERLLPRPRRSLPPPKSSSSSTSSSAVTVLLGMGAATAFGHFLV